MSIALAVALIGGGIVYGVDCYFYPVVWDSNPAIRFDPQQPFENPAIRFDPQQPFELEIGRGSGWHGLDTVKIFEDGRITMHRLHYEVMELDRHLWWEHAELALNPAQRQSIGEAVLRHGLRNLHKQYHAREIRDGTQWVLCICQGSEQKAVYFNNSFPSSIRAFAHELDEVLKEAGMDNAVWQQVPASDARKHEQGLWNSIREKTIPSDADPKVQTP